MICKFLKADLELWRPIFQLTLTTQNNERNSETKKSDSEKRAHTFQLTEKNHKHCDMSRVGVGSGMPNKIT